MEENAKKNLLKSSHRFAKMPCIQDLLREHRHCNGRTDKEKLQSGVDLGDFGWFDLCRREGKVPVAGHCFRGWEGNPAVIYRGQCQAYVAAEDDHSKGDCVVSLYIYSL